MQWSHANSILMSALMGTKWLKLLIGIDVVGSNFVEIHDCRFWCVFRCCKDQVEPCLIPQKLNLEFYNV